MRKLRSVHLTSPHIRVYREILESHVQYARNGTITACNRGETLSVIEADSEGKNIYTTYIYIYIYIYIYTLQKHKDAPQQLDSRVSVTLLVRMDTKQTEGSAVQEIHVATFTNTSDFVRNLYPSHSCYMPVSSFI